MRSVSGRPVRGAPRKTITLTLTILNVDFCIFGSVFLYFCPENDLDAVEEAVELLAPRHSHTLRRGRQLRLNNSARICPQIWFGRDEKYTLSIWTNTGDTHTLKGVGGFSNYSTPDWNKIWYWIYKQLKKLRISFNQMLVLLLNGSWKNCCF